MPRWQGDAQARLQEAAFNLFEERGYDDASVEQIAQRAGLTKRTFFRYFADKREVLFWGAHNVEVGFTAAIESASQTSDAVEAMATGFQALAAGLEEQGDVAVRRIRILRATPQLWERQLIKFGLMADAAARALQTRGVGAETATLVAETGMTVFRVAVGRWLEDSNNKPLPEIVAEALTQLRTVVNPNNGSC